MAQDMDCPLQDGFYHRILARSKTTITGPFPTPEGAHLFPTDLRPGFTLTLDCAFDKIAVHSAPTIDNQ
jgi:hypothetical protein